MSNEKSLRPVIVIALMGWIGLGAVVTQVSPSTMVARLIFFALLYVALASSLSLVAYFFSFRLFTSKTYKGNLAHSVQQGGLWAAFFVAAAGMQAAHAMSILTAVVLLALFGLAGAIVLTRR